MNTIVSRPMEERRPRAARPAVTGSPPPPPLGILGITG
jgi:hypothetical protein